MTLCDCLCHIAYMCKLLSAVRILYYLLLQLPPQLLCTLAAILNSSLYCNLNVHVDIRCLHFSLSDLNSLSCALRKDHNLIHLKWKRSKSHCDLSVLQLEKNDIEVERKSVKIISRHYSCPDLFEMQSLHNMHPKLHKVLRSSSFYYSRVEMSEPFGNIKDSHEVLLDNALPST